MNSTSGVFPVPPQVIFPTLITAQGSFLRRAKRIKESKPIQPEYNQEKGVSNPVMTAAVKPARRASTMERR
jgi:hypothetical protein